MKTLKKCPASRTVNNRWLQTWGLTLRNYTIANNELGAIRRCYNGLIDQPLIWDRLIGDWHKTAQLGDIMMLIFWKEIFFSPLAFAK